MNVAMGKIYKTLDDLSTGVIQLLQDFILFYFLASGAPQKIPDITTTSIRQNFKGRVASIFFCHP